MRVCMRVLRHEISQTRCGRTVVAHLSFLARLKVNSSTLSKNFAVSRDLDLDQFFWQRIDLSNKNRVHKLCFVDI